MSDIQEVRDWQTLAFFCSEQGGKKIGVTPRTIKEEVCKYFTDVMFCDFTPEEVLQDFLPQAKKYGEAKFAITNWRNYLTAFQGKINSLARFSAVSEQDRNTFGKVVTAMKSNLSVEVGGRTENMGGVINVARTVVGGGEDTALFALFHEIGHGVQTEGDLPSSIKDAIYKNPNESGTRFGELFADAFSAIALNANGHSAEKIMKGAEGALADHGSDADHPGWPTRRASINLVLV